MSNAWFSRLVATCLGVGVLPVSALALLGEPAGRIPVGAGLVAHAAGLVAGYLATVMVLLMARAPVLERRVGPDVLSRWHKRCGPAFLLAILGHAGAAVVSWAQARGQDVVTALAEVLRMPGLVEATVGTGLFLLVAGLSVRAARRRVTFELWHLVHVLVYPAVVLSFLHELAGPNLAGRPVVQVLWTLMHAAVLGLALRHRFIGTVENLWRHRLRVEAVVPEADGVVSVVMKGRHVDELNAQAGQFFRWRFLTASTWRTAHPFSLSALPCDDRLRITVKALGDGSGLLQAVRPGTLVLPEGPSGAMTAARRTRSSVLLIAGGVGITPMRALFESLDVRPPGRLTLLYRASRPTDVVFRRELEDIARDRGAEIVWMIGPSSEPALQMSAATLRRLVPDVAERDVYLCASPGLSAAVRTGLRDAGVPRRRLHEEVFSF